MSKAIGRSVRLFLVDGTPTGVTTAEIMNWTGHVLTGSRTGLPAFLKRPELDRTGIYFLFGADPEDPEARRLYIGESDNVGKRLVQHSKDGSKDFWERTCVVTSKDQNITKAHARYLEARLIGIANSVGNAVLTNGTTPLALPLPEADASDMEYFIDQLRLVLPVLGFDFLRKSPKAFEPTAKIGADEVEPQEVPRFDMHSQKHKVEARAREVDGEFVVLLGSMAVPNWTSTPDHSYAKRHAHLVEKGKLVPDGNGFLRFTEDVPFSSPSAASAVILGRPDNGRLSWRLSGKGVNYGDWQAQKVAETAALVLHDDAEYRSGG